MATMTNTELIATNNRDMERFMRFVSMEPMSGCWLWLGGHNKAGYGMFWAQGRQRLPHRWIAAEAGL